MTPLYSFVLTSKQITPIDLLFSIPINSYLVLRDRKSFSLKIVLPLSILLLLGDIIGTLILQNTQDRILKIILSIFIIGIAIEMFTRPKSVQNKKPNKIFLGIIGIISGISAGLFGISVLLVAYISRTTSSRGSFRANLGFVFLINNFFRLFYYLTLPNPIITSATFRYASVLFPAVIIGMAIGLLLEKHIKEKIMLNILVLLLITSGLILFMQNIV